MSCPLKSSGTKETFKELREKLVMLTKDDSRFFVPNKFASHVNGEVGGGGGAFHRWEGVFPLEGCRVVADVWEKDVWEFQAKSGSSGSCLLFLHFLGKIAIRKMFGKAPGSPRRHSSRHPWVS